jgi:hypothetical protein
VPRSSECPHLLRLPNQNFALISHLPHARYMLRSYHSSWFHHPNNIWRGVQTMELLIVQFSLSFCHFIPLRYKYSPKHTVLKYRQSVFSFREIPGFTHIQNNN